MADSPPPQVQLQIQLSEEVAQGVYVNMAVVNHTETEFTLDLLYVQPHQPRATVRSRVITSPKHLKRLMIAMQDQIARYEQRFGTIEVLRFPPGTFQQ